MQPRFAALLFALGLVDLLYVNLGLGHEVFAEAAPAVSEAGPAPLRAPEPPREPEPRESAPPPQTPEPWRDPVSPRPPEPTAAPAPKATPIPAAAREPAAAPETAPPPFVDIEPSGAPASEPASASAFSAPASDLTVGFPDKATAILTRRAREELGALAERLRAHPEYRVRIVGHADARGSREFNRDLGGRRARVVSELLLRAGVAPEQLDTESRGEDEPRVSGTSERVWAANRRVEITIGSERSQTP